VARPEVSVEAVIEGPQWCESGLLQRARRYPLAVEAPVMAAVDALVPGVSTVTRYARYYGLYWTLAHHAGTPGWTARSANSSSVAPKSRWR
jgi:hypothetical protein